MIEKIQYNRDEKFDIQLSDSLIAERKLGETFAFGKIENPKFELKTESWLWERFGNICIEYRAGARPSGISVTEANYWVHELRRAGETLVYLMFPIERLKRLCRDAIMAGDYRVRAGDNGKQHVALIRLSDILR